MVTTFFYRPSDHQASLQDANEDEASLLPDSLRRSSKGNISLLCKDSNHEPTTLEDYLDDPANDATSFYNLYNTKEKEAMKRALHRIDRMLSWYLVLQNKCEGIGADWAVKLFIGPVVIGKAIWVGLRGTKDIGRGDDIV